MACVPMQRENFSNFTLAKVKKRSNLLFDFFDILQVYGNLHTQKSDVYFYLVGKKILFVEQLIVRMDILKLYSSCDIQKNQVKISRDLKG